MKDLKWIILGLIFLMAVMGITKIVNTESDIKKEEINITKENNQNEKQDNKIPSSDDIAASNGKSNDTINKESNKQNNQKIGMKNAILKTNKGDIEIELNGDKSPETVANFIKLAESNFYDGVRFHRVIKDFMIQTGDPLSKDVANKKYWGTGGPDYKFNDELSGDEKYNQGTLAMANSGPNTNGSQFFIVTAVPGYPLPPSYTVFGKVTKGIDNVMVIQNVKTDGSDKPLEDVIIKSIEIK